MAFSELNMPLLTNLQSSILLLFTVCGVLRQLIIYQFSYVLSTELTPSMINYVLSFIDQRCILFFRRNSNVCLENRDADKFEWFKLSIDDFSKRHLVSTNKQWCLRPVMFRDEGYYCSVAYHQEQITESCYKIVVIRMYIMYGCVCIYVLYNKLCMHVNRMVHTYVPCLYVSYTVYIYTMFIYMNGLSVCMYHEPQ